MSGPTSGVLKGALFTVSMRWTSRMIGVVSTLVLARLLMPDDFGVAAMASIVLGLASALLDLGVNVAIVRNAQATEEHYSSAWTLRLVQALAISLLLVAASPLAGDYFHDPRVTPVLALMALTVAIGGLENIGIVRFQKEMQFGREFRFVLINRSFSLACTVSLAYLLRSYWALVIAGTVSAVFSSAHSYVAHPMRPRWCTAKLPELLTVSLWLLVQNIGNYLDLNLHKLLVGRRDDASAMGAYSLAAEVAAIPSTELLQPLNRALFPAFVALKQDLERLKQAFLLAQSLQIMVAVPAAVFLALLAGDLVTILLGSKWLEVVPLLHVLALSYALLAIQASAWYVSITLGYERRCALVSWSQIALFAVLSTAFLPDAKAPQIAELRVLVCAVGLLLQLLVVAKALRCLTLGEIVRGIWRPALAIALTATIMSAAPWPERTNLLLLLVKSTVFGATYVSSLWLLWILSGRPIGAERYVVDRILSALRRDKRTSSTRT